jgi:hypothetical protein
MQNNFNNDFFNNLPKDIPEIDEQAAWDAMKIVLDKEMPVQQKKKRRVIFWWFLIGIVATGSIATMVLIGNKNNSNASATIQETATLKQNENKKLEDNKTVASNNPNSNIAKNSTNIDDSKQTIGTKKAEVSAPKNEINLSKSNKENYTIKTNIEKAFGANEPKKIKNNIVKINNSNLSNIEAKNNKVIIEKSKETAKAFDIKYIVSNSKNISKKLAKKITYKNSVPFETKIEVDSKLEVKSNKIKAIEKEIEDKKLIKSNGTTTTEIAKNKIEADNKPIKIERLKQTDSLQKKAITNNDIAVANEPEKSKKKPTISTKKIAYGLQCNPISINGYGNNFIDVKGNESVFANLIPELWVAKKLNNKFGIELHINPYSQQTINNQNIENNKQSYGVDITGSSSQNYTTNISKIVSLRKIISMQAYLLATYEPIKNVIFGLGLGYQKQLYNILNLQVLQNNVLNNDSNFSVSNINKVWNNVNDNNFFVKPQISYSIGRWAIGTSLTLPFSNLLTNNESKFINHQVFVKVRLSK